MSNNDEKWLKQAKEHYESIGFNPLEVKWLRLGCILKDTNDSRPLVVPPPGPWWESGIGEDYFNMVIYVPEGVSLEKYWPEIKGEYYAGMPREECYPDNPDTHIRFCEESNGVIFTDRFAKPGWWPF